MGENKRICLPRQLSSAVSGLSGWGEKKLVKCRAVYFTNRDGADKTGTGKVGDPFVFVRPVFFVFDGGEESSSSPRHWLG